MLCLQHMRVFKQVVTPVFSWVGGPHAFVSSLACCLLYFWDWAESNIRSKASGRYRTEFTTEPLKQAQAQPRPFWESEQGCLGLLSNCIPITIALDTTSLNSERRVQPFYFKLKIIWSVLVCSWKGEILYIFRLWSFTSISTKVSFIPQRERGQGRNAKLYDWQFMSSHHSNDRNSLQTI